MIRSIRVNRLAIVSLVLGILGLAPALLEPTSVFLFILPALIIGVVALRKIAKSKGYEKGETLAWIGIALSAIGLTYFTVFVLVYFYFLG